MTEEDVNVTRLIKKIRATFYAGSKEEAAAATEATGRIVAAIITVTKKGVTL